MNSSIEIPVGAIPDALGSFIQIDGHNLKGVFAYEKHEKQRVPARQTLTSALRSTLYGYAEDLNIVLASSIEWTPVFDWAHGQIFSSNCPENIYTLYPATRNRGEALSENVLEGIAGDSRPLALFVENLHEVEALAPAVKEWVVDILTPGSPTNFPAGSFVVASCEKVFLEGAALRELILSTSSECLVVEEDYKNQQCRIDAPGFSMLYKPADLLTG